MQVLPEDCIMRIFVWKNDRLVCFKDFVGDGNSPYDDNGHGTHVAGICGASGAASFGVYKGIAPKCHIIALKVLNKWSNVTYQRQV